MDRRRSVNGVSREIGGTQSRVPHLARNNRLTFNVTYVQMLSCGVYNAHKCRRFQIDDLRHYTSNHINLVSRCCAPRGETRYCLRDILITEKEERIRVDKLASRICPSLINRASIPFYESSQTSQPLRHRTAYCVYNDQVRVMTSPEASELCRPFLSHCELRLAFSSRGRHSVASINIPSIAPHRQPRSH